MPWSALKCVRTVEWPSLLPFSSVTAMPFRISLKKNRENEDEKTKNKEKGNWTWISVSLRDKRGMCLLCCFIHLFWIYFIALLFYVLLCTLTIYSIKYCTVHSKHSFIGSLFWPHFILNLQYWKQKNKTKRSVIICNERGSVLKAPDPSLCLIHLQSLPTFLINAPKHQN